MADWKNSDINLCISLKFTITDNIGITEGPQLLVIFNKKSHKHKQEQVQGSHENLQYDR